MGEQQQSTHRGEDTADCIEVRIKSTKGPIDVYLCEVEQDNPGAKTFEDMDTLTSETKSPVPLDEGM
ncbi:hypothetical protein UY3_10336 [Chelonia mydas]|uniref:Uncharacterized protein n=1 Tax=Chelonia mydas TaxID=8469 RepID=M7B5U9_CHEMY|nr:hypothetical protein UY3_10336 [Chelonia mydas]